MAVSTVPRSLLYAGIPLILVDVIVSAYVIATRGSVNRQVYNQIKIRMTKSEVEGILGAPYDGVVPLNHEDIHHTEGSMRTGSFSTHYWKDGDYVISVYFDFAGRVNVKYYTRDPDVNIFRRVIDWMGL